MTTARTRWRFISISSLLLTFIIACSSQPIQLVEMGEESGFGGTGIVRYSIAEYEEGSGFGGTGIVGSISAFGSIWVNGIEIDYPDDVVIESNLGTGLQQLKLGQTVILETGATPSAKNLPQTGRIRIHYQFAGPIQSLSDDAIVINGQRVALSAETLVDENLSLSKGEYLAVNALQDSNGQWLASRLNLNPSKNEVLQPLPDFIFSTNVTQVIVDERLEFMREQWHIRDHMKRDMRREPISRHHWQPGEHRGPMDSMRQTRQQHRNLGPVRSQLHDLHSIHQHIRQFPPPPDRLPPVSPP